MIKTIIEKADKHDEEMASLLTAIKTARRSNISDEELAQEIMQRILFFQDSIKKVQKEALKEFFLCQWEKFKDEFANRLILIIFVTTLLVTAWMTGRGSR